MAIVWPRPLPVDAYCPGRVLQVEVSLAGRCPSCRPAHPALAMSTASLTGYSSRQGPEMLLPSAASLAARSTWSQWACRQS